MARFRLAQRDFFVPLWLLLLLDLFFFITTTHCMVWSCLAAVGTQPVVVQGVFMGRDFPGRFGEPSELFSSTLSGQQYQSITTEIDPELSDVYGGGKQVVKKAAEIWAGYRVVVPHPRTDPTDPSEDLDCADQVRATRAVAEELSVMNEILRSNLGGMLVAQVECAGWLSRLYALIADRTPHRKWTQAAVLDFQQQLRDGFDALSQRFAQQIDADRHFRVPELELPELGPTPGAFDVETVTDFQTLLFKLSKQPVILP